VSLRNTRLTDQDLERIAQGGIVGSELRLDFAAKWARHLPAMAAELVDRRRAMRGLIWHDADGADESEEPNDAE
jgi:hypothetical protein